MPEAWDQLPTRAERLAAWTRLPVDSFRICYNNAMSGENPTRWKTLETSESDAAALIRAACAIAEDRGFLDDLAECVAKNEADSREGSDVAAMLNSVLSGGVLQGIINDRRGLMSKEVLLAAVDVLAASALVVDRSPAKNPLGTAFLIGPDLVLTAAHVVNMIDEQGGTKVWSTAIREDIAFEFYPTHGPPAAAPLRSVLPAPVRPLEFRANPHADPPSKLKASLKPPANDDLDFALIRLAQRVEDIAPLAFDGTSTVEDGRPCWVFGYAGGSAFKFDVNDVETIDPAAGRWLHIAETKSGMSGGCCLNHNGAVVGLHEGQVVRYAAGGGKVIRNRAISLKAIAAKIGGANPFAPRRSSQGLELSDPRLVEAHYRAGLRLAGDHAERWRQAFMAAFKLAGDPGEGATLPAFHPWFKRGEVEAWIDSGDRNARLCHVFGESGAGESFCAEILKAKVEGTPRDFLRFSPTQVALDWSVAMSQVLALAAPSPFRTAAANVNYNDVQQVVAELRRRAGEPRRPLFVAIDFGTGGSPDRLVGSPWLNFVLELVAEDWARVMLIGLERFERIALGDQVRDKPATATVKSANCEIAPISRDALASYAYALSEARGAALKESEVAAWLDEIWAVIAWADDAPAMRTVAAAFVAMLFEGAKLR